uniref:Uncharacterized protein n=1 Tax=Amphimedon queenslandica TaxID=400682 RepID=A0A1X7VHF0_AMPQE
MLCTVYNASVHYPFLRRLLKLFYVARNAHLTIDIIDSFLEDDPFRLSNLGFIFSIQMLLINL